MIWTSSVWRDVASGNRAQRIRAISTLVSWFAMGAFVFSTLDHHFPIVAISDHVVALVGGVTATIAAFCIKTA